MKSMLYLQGALSLVGALLIAVLVSPFAGVSFFAGGIVILINLVSLVFSIPRILAKKLVALSIGVIVFKFAILGLIIYLVVNGKLFNLLWFAAGMALVVPSVLITSLMVSQNPTEKAER